MNTHVKRSPQDAARLFDDDVRRHLERLVLENAADVLWHADLDLNFTYHSPSVFPFRGYTPEEANALAPADTFTKTSLDHAKVVLEDARANFSLPVKPKILELEYHRKNGGTVWGEVTAAFVLSPENTPIGLVGVTRNITQRKIAEAERDEYRRHLEKVLKERTNRLKVVREKLEEETEQHQQTILDLQKSREKYHLLIQNASQGIVITQHGELKYHNRKVREITGYSDDDLRTLGFIELIHPEDRERMIDHHRRRVAGEPVEEQFVLRIIKKDRTTAWLETHGVVVEWDGKPATLSFFSDFTERKKAETALREREKLYRDLFNNPLVGLVRTRVSDGKVFAANESAARILGYDRVADL